MVRLEEDAEPQVGEEDQAEACQGKEVGGPPLPAGVSPHVEDAGVVEPEDVGPDPLDLPGPVRSPGEVRPEAAGEHAPGEEDVAQVEALVLHPSPALPLLAPPGRQV